MSARARRANTRDERDESLMARYADGDGAAFEELFRRYEPRAYVFFLKRTGSSERSQDLYQDLFLRIHGARDAYDPGRPFAPWFFRIANRLLIDDYSRAYRNHEVPLDEREPRSARRGSEEVVADQEYVTQLLRALSAEERYVVLSAKVDGIGYPELAAHLGKSVDAVRKMGSRAIQRLRATAHSDAASQLLAG